MSVKKLRKTLLALSFFAGATFSEAQIRTTLIQQYTVTSNGATDTVDFMPLLVDLSGNVTVAGNNKVSATQYDALVAQQLSNGTNNWVNSFSSPTNQKAFISASCMDAAGNTYVTGAVRVNATNGLDMFVIGYKPSGTQVMSAYYNGPNSSSDVGIGICVDNNGRVFITGASDGLMPGITDYATIAFDAGNGTQLWEQRYDYSYFMDIPTAIVYDSVSAYVKITGSSGSTLTDWDVATVSYRASDGTQLATNRTPNAGAGFDKPFSMAADAAGNVYITGTKYNATTNNYDLQVQKLDTALATQWIKTYDGYGADDAGTSVAIDNSGNVIVIGVSYKTSGSKELVVLKYDNAGNPLHRFFYGGLNMDSQGLRVKISGNNDIFVGGEYGSNNSQDVCVLVLDSTCHLVGEKIFNGTTGQKDKFMDLAISSDNIYVSVRSNNGALDDNLVLNYKYKNFVYTPATDTATGANYVENQVVVNFNKASLKMTAINDREFKFGVLSDFVADSTCDKLSALLSADPKFKAGSLVTRKMVNLTEEDSLSESRLGEYVRVPQFYAGLLVSLPSVINTVNAANIIGTIQPDIIRAQLDHVFELNWVPNDTYYNSNQSSLHATANYANAHINCEKAWDRTKGKAFVRAGIYDSGTRAGMTDIVPTEGYGYIGNYDTDDQTNHGTSVAAIVGSKNNNNEGIAGIAGGDINDQGVSIITMKIGTTYLLPWHNMKQAFTEGASGQNLPHGKGLHIMNCSFGEIIASDPELLESVNYVNRNGVALVCSRGNKIPGSPFAVNAPNIPATLAPNITMNVGASGTDGHYHKINVNGVGYISMDSLEVDFIAPGADSNVFAPSGAQPGPPPFLSLLAPTAIIYKSFGGTSASAPHVTGVAALMMSYRNQNVSNWDNIVHEDVEALLKRTATDLADPAYGETVSYDQKTGWGRINADSALQALEGQYKIRHIDNTHYNVTVATVTSIAQSNMTLGWNQTTFGPPGGNYIVDVIEVQKHYTYSYGGETFLQAWPLYGPSKGYVGWNSSVIDTRAPGHVEVVFASNTNAITSTFVYHIKSLAATGTTLNNVYMPVAPNDVNSAFTLYTLGDNTTGIKNMEPEVNYFNVYPNPSSGNFTVGFNSKKETKGTVTIMDIMGKTVYEKQESIRAGVNRYDLTVNHLPKGIYFLSLDVENNKSLVKKLIIN